jgi:hypothetical protein
MVENTNVCFTLEWSGSLIEYLIFGFESFLESCSHLFLKPASVYLMSAHRNSDFGPGRDGSVYATGRQCSVCG